jgi:hypothetical protein
MNEHERVEELLAAEALGGLTDDGRGELDQAWNDHGRDCEQCRATRREFGEVSGRLAFALSPVRVRDGLEDEVLDRIAEDEGVRDGRGVRSLRAAGWGRRLAAGAAAVVLVGAGLLGGFLLAPREDPAQAALASLLAERGTRVVSFEGAAGGSLKVAFRSGEDSSFVIGSSLGPAPEGKVYKLWIVPADGSPVPGPSFAPEGGETLIVRLPADPSGSAAVAITFEEDPDVTAPTTDPVYVAPITA